MEANKNSAASQSRQMAKILFAVNRLNLRAHSCKTKESLIFLILNDTINVAHYDRALLWDLTTAKPWLLGISGQSELTKNKELIKRWNQIISEIEDKKKPQIFIIERLENIEKLNPEDKKDLKSTILWLPIFSNEKLTLGMWMELWGDHKDNPPPDDLLGLLVHLLMPSFGLAWEKLTTRQRHWRKIPHKKLLAMSLVGLLFLSLFLIHVPLRIVAQCKVVALDPYIVRAPMEGIISEVLVKPGQLIKKGTILFEYDKNVPIHELNVAKKEVEVIESKLKRAISVSLDDDNVSTNEEDYSVLRHQLAKSKIDLEHAKYHASLLTNYAKQSGVIILDNQDELRGKPVKVGEKILAISDPSQTKLKILIPEKDNVKINFNDPVKIILNVEANKTYRAKLLYISSEVEMSEKNIPSFVAEAEWIGKNTESKLGLEGTAIIYGEKVSLWYFIFRKPIAIMRYYLGF